MTTWDPLANILQPTEMSAIDSGGNTLTVANAAIAAISLSGAALNAAVGTVADITNPSAWTTLVNITGGPLVARINGDEKIDIGVTTLNTGLRVQLLVDGAIIYDVRIRRGTSDLHTIKMQAVQDIYCKTSFLVRAAKDGNFSDVYANYIKIGVSGGIAYEYVQKVS